MGAACLRVAVVLDSPQAVPAWAAQAIRDIQNSDFAEVTSLVAGNKIPQKEISARKINPSLLFKRYRAWDLHRHGSELDPLLPVDLSDELTGVPPVNWAAVSADVVLWFSSFPPFGISSQGAPLCVWVYRGG